MVGLSVVLEGYNNNNNNSMMKSYSSSGSSCTRSCNSCTSPTIVSKSSMIKTCSPTTSPKPSTKNPFSRRSFSLPSNRNLQINGFLDHCFLCRINLLPGKDIYMYKGDRAFCSEECRCRQIFMDEEEAIKVKGDNCSFSAIKPQHASSSSSSSTSSNNNNNKRKEATKRANGFAY